MITSYSFRLKWLTYSFCLFCLSWGSLAVAQPGQALNFENPFFIPLINDWVDAGNNANPTLLPQGSNPWTVEIWVRTSQGNSFFGGSAIGNMVSWGTRLTNQRAGIAVRNGQAAFIGQLNDVGPKTGGTPINDNKWHHIAVVNEGNVPSPIKIYVDGVLENSGGNPLNLTGQDLRLGLISQPSVAEYYNGDMDEVRIWNYARTAAEINTDKDTELSGAETGLLTYYNFNQGVVGANNSAQNFLIDQAGNNSGNLINFGLVNPSSNWIGDGPPISPYVPPAGGNTITAYVWDDQNGNGKQDGSEPPLANVQVDLLKFGTLIPVASAQTQANGEVTFNNVSINLATLKFYRKNAKYAFTFQDQAGVNDNQDSDASRVHGETAPFTVSGNITNIDCGQWSPGFIEAYIWDDRNGNGKQDGTEPSILGSNVQLVDAASQNVLQIQSSGPDGIARFSDVPADKSVFLVFQTRTSNHAFTLANKAGVNDNQDSDANRTTGKSAAVRTRKGAEVITKMDCGQWSPGIAQPYVWDDRNGNGKQDGSEPPIAGVDVSLQTPGGSVLGTGMTNASGIANIPGIPADQDVVLVFDLKDDDHAYTLANKAGVNENKDSDANRTNGKTPTFRTKKGAEVVSKMDCGQWSPGQVIAFVWDDRNGNGKQDGTEPGIMGADVRLETNAGTLLDLQTTDTNGNVSLNGVPADQFVRLIFSLKDSNHAFTIANKPGVNENKDSNADRITGRTAVFKTSKGAETILNQDCGQWSPGSVEAYVWDDRNGNGKRDGSEPPLEGVNVELVHHSSGQIITNAYTDQSGVASLAGLPADQGVHLTFYLKDATHAFTIANKASVNENQDSDANRTTGQTAVFFTDRGAQTITNQDAGQWSPGIVEARIWNDLNNNGKQDGSEHGLPFVQVDLIQQGGIVLLSTLSDASGIARFEIVPADRNLKLKFHKRANTFTQTTVDKPGVNENRDSDARLPTGETGLFKTDRGRQLITNLDAGFVVDYTDDTDNDGIPDFQDKYLLDNTNDGKAAITSRVWDDQNADGLQSSGEKGLGEVEVYLYDAVSNTLLSSTITHPYNGEAVFFDIPPAAMRFLEYIVPSGLSFSSQDSGTDDDLDSDINPIDGRSPSFVALAVVSAFDAGLSTPTSAPARLATEEVAIQAYPNPTSGKLNLEGIAGYERVRIFDSRGQLIQVHALTEGQNQLFLTISDLAAGIYFLRIESADTVKTEQIVKR